LFQSLLFEACGRTVNPVDGAVGLLARGKWHVCQMAVETVLAGGTLSPLTELETNGVFQDPSGAFMHDAKQEDQPSDLLTLSLGPKLSNPWTRMKKTMSFNSEDSEMSSFGSSGNDRKLLNLFL
jgi:hypothetical protein